MTPEWAKLKQCAETLLKLQVKGSLKDANQSVGTYLSVFRALGQGVMEAGDRGEMLAYYDRISRFFRDTLVGKTGAQPTLDEACRFYDLLYMMKWRSINEPTDLTSFNPYVLEPFVAFLKTQPWPNQPENRREASGRSPAKLAYIASWSNLSSSNACARVAWTTIRGHKELHPEADSVVVYCTVPPEPELIEAARKASVVLKNMRHPGGYAAAAQAILREAEKDGIDGVVIDTPDALATVLIVKRMAPVQIYLELGFDAWRAPNVDFIFQSFSTRWSELATTPEKCAQLPLIDHMDFLAPERDPAEIEMLRQTIQAAIPAGEGEPVVYGFFGRMTKVTLPYLKLVERILQATPRAVCYIGGSGGQSPITENLLKGSPVANRIVYQPKYVDGHVVGRVITVFLDTFPFPGSLACLECQGKGVPVVWMPAGYKDLMAGRLEVYRDQTLRAGSEDEFVRLAVELAQPARRAEASATALGLAHKFGDGKENAGKIEAAIDRLMPVEAVEG
ncbi:MAG: hypothetical protein JWM32_2942 [Verrucomicrobia bacterium]|nr:hypothetical protein [Verrucomicrobiota bacterium]